MDKDTLISRLIRLIKVLSPKWWWIEKMDVYKLNFMNSQIFVDEQDPELGEEVVILYQHKKNKEWFSITALALTEDELEILVEHLETILMVEL